jgi:hypothetical protein
MWWIETLGQLYAYILTDFDVVGDGRRGCRWGDVVCVFTILAVEVILLALKLVTKREQISGGRRSGDERVSGRATLIDARTFLLRQQPISHGLFAS